MKYSTRLRWSAVVCWLIVILFLTFLPGSAVPIIEIDHFDLFGHVVMYGVLSALLMLALCRYTWRAGAAMILACVALGVFTEVVQELFVPGRCGSVADGIADFLGATVASVAFVLWHKSSEGRCET